MPIAVTQNFKSLSEQKHRIVVVAIKYYNSPFPTPNHDDGTFGSFGIACQVHTPEIDNTLNFDESSIVYPSSVDEYASLSNCAYFFGSGTVFNLSLDPSKTYYILLRGSFYAEESSSDLTFYFVGETGILAEFNQTEILNGGTAGSYADINTTGYTDTSSTPQTVVAGSWYNMSIKHKISPNEDRAGLAVMYSYDGGSTKHLLNAGVFNHRLNDSALTNGLSSGFVTGTTLPGVKSVERISYRRDPSEVTFSLPLTLAYRYDGGYASYDNGNSYKRLDMESPTDESLSITLKKGRLIKVFAGYRDSNDIDYTIERFTGKIIEFSENNGELTVRCQDFKQIPATATASNIPDRLSYWIAGYFAENESSEPDGYNAVGTYDRWNLIKAVKDLYLGNSKYLGLPFALFNGKRKHTVNGIVVEGGDLIVDNGINLDSAVGYKQNSISESERFKYSISTGDKLIDHIENFIETYGYFSRFTNEGMLEIVPINSPYKIKNGIVLSNMMDNGGLVDPNMTLLGTPPSTIETTPVIDEHQYSCEVTVSGMGVQYPYQTYEDGESYLASVYAYNNSGSVGILCLEFQEVDDEGTVQAGYDTDWNTQYKFKRMDGSETQSIPSTPAWARFYVDLPERTTTKELVVNVISLNTTEINFDALQIEQGEIPAYTQPLISGAVTSYKFSQQIVDFEANGGQYRIN